MQPSSVQPPERYGRPFSLTVMAEIDSPLRSGISRKPPLNGPLKS